MLESAPFFRSRIQRPWPTSNPPASAPARPVKRRAHNAALRTALAHRDQEREEGDRRRRQGQARRAALNASRERDRPHRRQGRGPQEHTPRARRAASRTPSRRWPEPHPHRSPQPAGRGASRPRPRAPHSEPAGGSSHAGELLRAAHERKPVSRILVINDEPLVLREFVKGLNAAARSLDNPLGITFTGVTTAREALAAIETDGDIQAVLVDDKLYTPGNERQGSSQASCRCRRSSWCSASRACAPSSTSTS